MEVWFHQFLNAALNISIVGFTLGERTTRHSINSTLGRPLGPVRTFWLREIYPITAGIPIPDRPGRSIRTANYAMQAGFSLFGAKIV